METLCIAEDSLDDLLRAAVEAAMERGVAIRPSKGDALDLNAASLQLGNPLARLSRSSTRGRLFSCLGELCWYLSGSDSVDQIAYYVPRYRDFEEEGKLYGAYGPRVFGGYSQFEGVLEILRRKPDSRQAVIQVFEGRDLEGDHKDVPCTCVLQFLVRRERLELVVYMRSNDIYLGMPHDIFSFTMFQELAARSLQLPLGVYVHMVGSLHLYTGDQPAAELFLREGWQSRDIVMPAMPDDDPWPSVQGLLEAEASLREGQDPMLVALPVDPYWSDLVRVLQVFALNKAERWVEATEVAGGMINDVYRVFVADLMARRAKG